MVMARCISFDSYIKPQLVILLMLSYVRCISFDSYIKPQLLVWILLKSIVVYLLTPTSNHNITAIFILHIQLYIF
mgnify:CR=1 FL=1